VWLEGQNLNVPYNKKIMMKHKGPFSITEKLFDMTYQLKLPKRWTIHDRFHAVLLSPYEETPTHGLNFPRPPPDLIDGEQEWEIERIMKHCKICTKKGQWQNEYQVLWKGYEEPTWEPSENLEHSKESITDYWNY